MEVCFCWVAGTSQFGCSSTLMTIAKCDIWRLTKNNTDSNSHRCFFGERDSKSLCFFGGPAVVPYVLNISYFFHLNGTPKIECFQDTTFHDFQISKWKNEKKVQRKAPKEVTYTKGNAQKRGEDKSTNLSLPIDQKAFANSLLRHLWE